MRIIAGSYGGRKIRVPKGRTVRPTQDRTREAIFNLRLIAPEGKRVLDLYAGSGALGIEALSRGARHVTFVERDARVARVLRENLESLAPPRDATRVVVRAVERALARRGGLVNPASYELILADPPYELGLGEALLEKLGEKGGAPLSPETLLLIETETGALPFDARHGFYCVFRRRYGDSEVSLWRQSAEISKETEEGRSVS